MARNKTPLLCWWSWMLCLQTETWLYWGAPTSFRYLPLPVFGSCPAVFPFNEWGDTVSCSFPAGTDGLASCQHGFGSLEEGLESVKLFEMEWKRHEMNSGNVSAFSVHGGPEWQEMFDRWIIRIRTSCISLPLKEEGNRGDCWTLVMQ